MLVNIFANAAHIQIFWIILWIAAFLVTLAIELTTTQLVSIWFSGSSLICLILAICNVPVLIQIIVWVVASIVLLILSRLIFKKRFDVNSTKTNTDSLIGEDILITGKVTKEFVGEGKIRDVVWTVATTDELPIEEGEFAKVVKIQGNRLFVTRKGK